MIFFCHTLLSGLSSFPNLFLTRNSLVTIQYALSMASVSFKAEQPGIDTVLQMSFYMYSASNNYLYETSYCILIDTSH